MTSPSYLLEAASLREKHGDVSWVVSTPRSPSPSAAAFIGFAAQAKPVRFGSAGTSPLHTLPFGFNQGDAGGGRKGYEFDRQRCTITTLSFGRQVDA